MRPTLNIKGERRRPTTTPTAPRRRPRPAPPTPQLRRRVDELRKDADAERVREFGGPRDQAQYVCECGLAFDAPVTTSVTCPHCGTGQAW